ncbi:PREDICTED: uncharacterized protein LOC103332832 isoform X3 [Prunus mume]|uniref:Uncharacterized protein LOC103332832 isoform X3 n=1 Tax=Prunus mume TaxID=102107 RepID=A0ABM1LR92_PRUMU|nr:PREDICTED: uncharacterized protein LOC103332832 isoform X3 [Prunus mume]
MVVGGGFMKWVLVILAILDRVNSVSANCHFSVIDDNKLYDYSLGSPIPLFPHGIQSEDGFYKVAANETVLWFQLCDGMIFNHDPPRCVDCWDCGGPSRCGMGCSALVANNIGGYDVCSTIGRASSIDINIIDKKNPNSGVIVKMSNSGLKRNCSLSVSVICDPNRVQGPHSLEKTGKCDYSLMPFWSISAGWGSLSIFQSWSSWNTRYSKLGLLDQLTSENTESICIFIAQI